MQTHCSMQNHHELCVKSSLWNIFKKWICLVKINNHEEGFNPSEFYKHTLPSHDSYHARAAHLLYIFKLPHDATKEVTAVQEILELMHDES